MNCIKKIQIGDTIYDADVSFRNIIRCNEIAIDKSITDFERQMAMIYIVFGEKGLKIEENYVKLIDWLLDYSLDGKELEKVDKPDMDYTEDMDYIEASFMSDYNIDLDVTDMDWHKFNKLINGLSTSNEGNCCVLNRIRNIRNIDLSKIKDDKERHRIKEVQDKVALKKYKKENNLTDEQLKSIEELNKKIGI